MTEQFFANRVVTRTLASDLVEAVRQRVGLRQRGYEESIDGAATEVVAEVHEEYDVEWYRVDVDPLGPRSISVSVYGEGEPRDA